MYNDLFGDYVATMVQLMWQHETSTRAVTQFIEECMEFILWMHMVILALRARHQISPRWLEMVSIFSSFLHQHAIPHKLKFTSHLDWLYHTIMTLSSEYIVQLATERICMFMKRDIQR